MRRQAQRRYTAKQKQKQQEQEEAARKRITTTEYRNAKTACSQIWQAVFCYHIKTPQKQSGGFLIVRVSAMLLFLVLSLLPGSNTPAKQLLCGGYSAYRQRKVLQNKGWYHKSNPQPGDQIFFHNDIRIYNTGIVDK